MMKRALYVATALFFLMTWFSFVYLVQNDYFTKCLPSVLGDEIIDIDSGRVNIENDGKMVYVEGKMEVNGMLKDSLYGIERNAAMLIRKVRCEKSGESTKEIRKPDYLTPMEYAADFRDCRLGAFQLRNFEADIAWNFEPLTEHNIPDILKNRATLSDGELHIEEKDGAKYVVYFISVGGKQDQRGRFVGRQRGNVIDLCFYELGYFSPKGPKRYYRHNQYDGSDITMRVLFAFLLASLSGFFLLFFIHKAFATSNSEERNYMGIFITTSVSLTFFFFSQSLSLVLQSGLDEWGFKIHETLQWIHVARIGMQISLLCFIIAFIYFWMILYSRRRKNGRA